MKIKPIIFNGYFYCFYDPISDHSFECRLTQEYKYSAMWFDGHNYLYAFYNKMTNKKTFYDFYEAKWFDFDALALIKTCPLTCFVDEKNLFIVNLYAGLWKHRYVLRNTNKLSNRLTLLDICSGKSNSIMMYDRDNFVLRHTIKPSSGWGAELDEKILCEPVCEFKNYKISDYSIIYYDFETIPINNVHYPYMCAYKVDDAQVECIWETDWSCLMRSELVYKFVTFLAQLAKKVKRLVGFNNFNYDDIFIYHVARKHPLVNRVFKGSRNGQMGELNIKFNNNTQLVSRDLIQYVQGKLFNICKEFEIQKAKVDFNIMEFNRQVIAHHNFFYDQNKFEECVYYCKLDVECLPELLCKLDDILREIFPSNTRSIIFYKSTPHISDYLTRSLCKFERWRFMCAEHVEYIGRAKFGGRVNYGVVGLYSSNICYIDVTSMYPTAMTGYYPCGQVVCEPDIVAFQSFIDALVAKRLYTWPDDMLNDFAILDKNFMGYYQCTVFIPSNVANLIAYAPVMERVKINDLNYIEYFNCCRTRVLNNIQIKTFLYAGWNVRLERNKNNIAFTDAQQLLRPYVYKLRDLKEEYKLKGLSSKTKMVKLLLNAAYGKLAQRESQVLKKTQLLGTWIERSVKINKSYHYLSAYITSHSNFILFSTAYRLNRRYIEPYLNNPMKLQDDRRRPKLENMYPPEWYERLGTLLYTDTDSIIYDKNKASSINIKMSSAIGEWHENDFCANWGEEYENRIKHIFVAGRKSYALYDEKEATLCAAFKGISKSSREFAQKTSFTNCLSLFCNSITFSKLGIKKTQTECKDEEMTRTLSIETCYQHHNSSQTSFTFCIPWTKQVHLFESRNSNNSKNMDM